MATSRTTRRAVYAAISVKAIQQGLRRRKIMFAPAALSVLCAEAAVRHGTDSEYTALRNRVLPALRAANARFHAERRRMHAALRQFLQASREYCLTHPEHTHAAAASMLLAALLTTMVLQQRHSQLRQPTRPSAVESAQAAQEAVVSDGAEGSAAASGAPVWLDAALAQLRKGAAAARGASEGVAHSVQDAAAAAKEGAAPALQQAGGAVQGGMQAAAAVAADVARSVPQQVGDLVQTLRGLVAAAPEEADDGAPVSAGAAAAAGRTSAQGLDRIARRLLSPEVLLYGMALSEMHVRGMLPGGEQHQEAREKYTRGIVVSGRDVKAAVVGAWRATASMVAAVMERTPPLPRTPIHRMHAATLRGGLS